MNICAFSTQATKRGREKGVNRYSPLSLCGARKTLRAYADPCVFRPLQKTCNAFICPRQRHYTFTTALRRKGGECRPDAKLKLKEKPPDFWKAFAYNTMLLFLVTICCYDLFVIVYVAPFLKQQTEIYVSFLIISVMVLFL